MSPPPLRSMAILLLSGLLLAPLPAVADPGSGFRPIFVGLGFVKAPGIAFDLVGGFRVLPHLSTLDATPGLGDAARFSLVSNFVTAGLHAVSIATMVRAGTNRAWDTDQATLFGCMTNAVADLGVAVLGLSSGVDLVVRVKAAELTKTDAGIGASWSGWVNIVMGSLGAVWFVPMVAGGLLGWSEVAQPAMPAVRGPRADQGRPSATTLDAG